MSRLGNSLTPKCSQISHNVDYCWTINCRILFATISGHPLEPDLLDWRANQRFAGYFRHVGNLRKSRWLVQLMLTKVDSRRVAKSVEISRRCRSISEKKTWFRPHVVATYTSTGHRTFGASTTARTTTMTMTSPTMRSDDIDGRRLRSNLQARFHIRCRVIF